MQNLCPLETADQKLFIILHFIVKHSSNYLLLVLRFLIEFEKKWNDRFKESGN